MMAMPDPQTTNTTNGSGASKLSALKDLNWPTLILIMFSGGANLLSTQRTSADREYQVDQALRQIRELHDALDDFQKHQKSMLDSQSQLLEHDSELLREVHAISLRLDTWKRNEQMRGAPQ